MKIIVVFVVRQRTGDLAQRLGHQPGLQADVAVPHLALDLGPRHQRGHRVDHDEVDRAGADQHVGDLQRLLTGVRLGDQQRVGVDAERLGVVRVERVLGVDERGDAAGRLDARHGVQGDRRLARRTPGRRSRRPGRAAGRRCRARCPGRWIPVGITSTGARLSSPRRITEPLPNCFSIWASAIPRAFSRSGAVMTHHAFLSSPAGARHVEWSESCTGGTGCRGWCLLVAGFGSPTVEPTSDIGRYATANVDN